MHTQRPYVNSVNLKKKKNQNTWEGKAVGWLGGTRQKGIGIELVETHSVDAQYPQTIKVGEFVLVSPGGASVSFRICFCHHCHLLLTAQCDAEQGGPGQWSAYQH